MKRSPHTPEIVPLLTIRDLARIYGVSVRTCETLIATGEIPAPIRVGRQRRWHPTTIQSWLQARGA